MKRIKERDYLYLGVIDGWHAFKSRPEVYEIPEIVLTPVAAYTLNTGNIKVFHKVGETKRISDISRLHMDNSLRRDRLV